MQFGETICVSESYETHKTRSVGTNPEIHIVKPGGTFVTMSITGLNP
jgi:hypothetical protein